jgi:cell division protein FtsQ
MNEVKAQNLIYLPSRWHYRLLGNIIILGFIAFICFITMIVKTDFVLNQFSALGQQVFKITTQLGFTLDDVLIEGRDRTSKEDVDYILNLERGDNILQIDIKKIKNNLEKLPWVKQAIVKRSMFPNVIHITLFERKVRAIWQIHDKFYPIDTEGTVINAKFTTYEPILLIVGKGAPENITKLLDIVSNDPEISDRIKVANFISERRWNLILDDIENGITVKMPEENIENAWKKLIKLNSTKGLLKRKLTIIDLRFEDKVILKLEKNKPNTDVKERTT